MIELQNVCKTYKVARRNAGLLEAVRAMFHKECDYIKALDNVSFKINEGEMVGYIGPNGAGKISLLANSTSSVLGISIEALTLNNVTIKILKIE